MRLPVKHALPLAALILLAGCGLGGNGTPSAVPPPPTTGPAADYPMVLGDPFTIAGTTYRPEDKFSYDEVGYAALGEAGATNVTGANKTLPLPSYVEVTALDSGKTILMRLERRGPMDNDHLIELSPGAAAQLGVTGNPKAPVRVRRVNPPEIERATLRSGGQVPDRMETPKGLLTVLMRKLNGNEPLKPAAPDAAATPSPAKDGATPASKPLPIAKSAPKPEAKPTPAAKPAPLPKPLPAPKPTQPPEAKPAPVAKPVPAPKPAKAADPRPTATGSFTVQVASFSTEERAKAAAGKLGAKVGKAGRFWPMQLGPFATRVDAQAALAKAKAAGYSDARIQRAD